MSNFSVQSEVSISTVGVDTATTALGTVITANSSSNVKGSWVELSSSTPHDATGIYVIFSSPNDTNARYLTDISIGAASSEQVLIPNLFFKKGVDQYITPNILFIPIRIASGSRVAARTQCSTSGSKNILVSIILVKDFGFFNSFDNAITIGSDTSISAGPEVDAGGTANTKGSWVQLIASTSVSINQLLLMIHSNNSSVTTDAGALVDIGVGAGGSEIIVIENIPVGLEGTAVREYMSCNWPFNIHIPSGSRIAIRSQCSTNNNPSRLFRVVGLGLY